MRINQESAKETLQKAYNLAKFDNNISCNHKEFIEYVLGNTHLTYKYVLFTAILSKATDAEINPLCLQKKSQLPGAYDARTICHKVIVPFEMEELHKVIGGSNEPFLNKPARFPEISRSNAVRSGNDQSILYSLCENLPLIATEKEAFNCLVFLLKYLLAMRNKKDNLKNFTIEKNDNSKAKFFKFALELLRLNSEGEILTLVVAGLYKQFLRNAVNYRVEVHPVNQSGASGKEISDLDIYIAGEIYATNELKDKDFEYTDIKHAADKVIEAGEHQLFFIVGLHGKAKDPENIEKLIKEYLNNGFIINILPINLFLNTMLGLIFKIDVDEFIKYTLQVAIETKFKQETITYLLNISREYYHLNYSI